MNGNTALMSSSAPAGSGDTMPPLRLLVDGLASEECSTLETMLDMLACKLPRAWVRVEGDEADLYLHGRGVRRSSVRAGVTAVLVREEEPKGLIDELWVPVPFRVMAVLDLLHGAHDRLGNVQADATADHAAHTAPATVSLAERPAPAASALSPTVADAAPAAPASAAPSGEVANATETVPAQHAMHDEKTLAFSLARLLVGRVEHGMRVRILGFGTMYVCPPSQTYRTDFEQARLRDALEAKRFVLTAISACSSELEGADQRARPMDELLWSIGLMTPRDRHEGTPPRVRLKRWPDLARLPHEPRHLQACALLTSTALDPQALMDACGLDENQADHFLHACELCGLLETVVAAPAAQAPKPLSSTSSLAGLFDRLWGRLVK